MTPTDIYLLLTGDGRSPPRFRAKAETVEAAGRGSVAPRRVGARRSRGFSLPIIAVSARGGSNSIRIPKPFGNYSGFLGACSRRDAPPGRAAYNGATDDRLRRG